MTFVRSDEQLSAAPHAIDVARNRYLDQFFRERPRTKFDVRQTVQNRPGIFINLYKSCDFQPELVQ